MAPAPDPDFEIVAFVSSQDLDAGDFSSWLSQAEAAIRGEGDADVACGSCVACCTSSQFVHIEPDEAATLARIPSHLLVPAPGLPDGHVVMGYDDAGRCPMLAEGGCSIYEDRPRTCRTYDCRVFVAAGVEPDAPDIAARTARWRFRYLSDLDRARHDATRAAAASLDDARGATARAVRAVEIHRRFLRDEPRDG